MNRGGAGHHAAYGREIETGADGDAMMRGVVQVIAGGGVIGADVVAFDEVKRAGKGRGVHVAFGNLHAAGNDRTGGADWAAENPGEWVDLVAGGEVALNGIEARGIGVEASCPEELTTHAIATPTTGCGRGTACGFDPALAQLLQSPVMEPVGVHGETRCPIAAPKHVRSALVAGVASQRVAANASHRPVVGDGRGGKTGVYDIGPGRE